MDSKNSSNAYNAESSASMKIDLGCAYTNTKVYTPMYHRCVCVVQCSAVTEPEPRMCRRVGDVILLTVASELHYTVHKPEWGHIVSYL